MPLKRYGFLSVCRPVVGNRLQGVSGSVIPGAADIYHIIDIRYSIFHVFISTVKTIFWIQKPNQTRVSAVSLDKSEAEKNT